MNKRKLILIFFILLLIAIIVSYNIGIISGRRSMFSKHKVSLSGKHELLEVYSRDFMGSRHVELIVISNIENEDDIQQLAFIIEPYSLLYTRFRLFSSWGKEDTLWIVSSDIGILCWVFEDGEWREFEIDENTLMLAPDDVLEYWSKYYSDK